MQARVDWVLRIFGTQVKRKKRPLRPVFPDYLSVCYDYGLNKSLEQVKIIRAKKLTYICDITYPEKQGVCENRQNTMIPEPHKLISFQTA